MYALICHLSRHSSEFGCSTSSFHTTTGRQREYHPCRFCGECVNSQETETSWRSRVCEGVLGAAAELLAPDKVQLFQSVSVMVLGVSQPWQSACLEELCQTGLLIWHKILEKHGRTLQETLSIFLSPIFVHGITGDCGTKEELLSLQAMHGTTKGEDLFEQVVVAMNKFELPFEKSSGLATDGAPTMVGAKKGLTALVKKKWAIWVWMQVI